MARAPKVTPPGTPIWAPFLPPLGPLKGIHNLLEMRFQILYRRKANRKGKPINGKSILHKPVIFEYVLPWDPIRHFSKPIWPKGKLNGKGIQWQNISYQEQKNEKQVGWPRV